MSFTLFKNSELLPILMVTAITIAIFTLVFKLVKKTIKHDIYYVSVLTIIYAIVSLWKLGSPIFPTTTWQPIDSEQSFILELPNESHFDEINVISGLGHRFNQDMPTPLGIENITISGSNDLNSWEEIASKEDSSIYQYHKISKECDYQYIQIKTSSLGASISEIGFKNTEEEVFLPARVYEDANKQGVYPASLTIDEQNTLVLYPTYYDQGFFDEIYHPRNAWEIANNEPMYASVHPLLGTNIMALFIKVFGMSPLVWRLPGALFGICMVPLMYAFAHMLFHSSFVSIFTTTLLSFDFMHYTTSRIGTLEPFSVFFILLMYYFMARYCLYDMLHTPLKKQFFTLGSSAIAMALGIATKWTACYSAVGLAIILFTYWILQYRKCHTKEEKSTFMSHLYLSIAFCILFFLLIPIVIYWISFLPDRVWTDGWSIENVWRHNIGMYDYHANLDATHPFQSNWIDWIFDLRPIWYAFHHGANDSVSTISCFSNPFFTWLSIPAFIYMCYQTIKTRSLLGWMIIVASLSALLPWVSLVDRCVFAYHFYPTSVFLMLGIGYTLHELTKKNHHWKDYSISFLIIYILLFIVYLPVISGFQTTAQYIQFLRLLPRWYFG